MFSVPFPGACLTPDYLQGTHSRREYYTGAVIFSGTYGRYTMICPSCVMLMLITWPNSCPISPLRNYNSPPATNKQHVGRHFNSVQIPCSSPKFPPRFNLHWFSFYPISVVMLTQYWLFSSTYPPHLAVSTQHSTVGKSFAASRVLYYWYDLMVFHLPHNGL